MQGFYRYWTPYIKKLLAELSQAESEKESTLKDILQRLVGRFCEHHDKWRHLVSAIAGLSTLFMQYSSFLPMDWLQCHPTCVSGMHDLYMKKFGYFFLFFSSFVYYPAYDENSPLTDILTS